MSDMTETDRAAYMAWRYAAPKAVDFREAGNMEVLQHHLTHGAVWDGNQVSKRHRGHLLAAGMVSRVDGSGYHALTRYGSRVARRTRPVWLALKVWTWLLNKTVGDKRSRLRSALYRPVFRLTMRLANALTPSAPDKCERHIP